MNNQQIDEMIVKLFSLYQSLEQKGISKHKKFSKLVPLSTNDKIEILGKGLFEILRETPLEKISSLCNKFNEEFIYNPNNYKNSKTDSARLKISGRNKNYASAGPNAPRE